MISKQSGRMVFHGREHKDLFYRGEYFPVMAAKNEEGCDGVIWRKLFPDRYYTTISSQWHLYSYSTRSNYGIYYNELDIYREEFRFMERSTFVKGARFVAFVITPHYSSDGYKNVYLSKDGKYFKILGLDHVICAGPFFVMDGFVYVYDDGKNYSGGTSYFYHVRVDEDMNKLGEEKQICAIQKGENNYSITKLILCPHVSSDPNVILYGDGSNLYTISLDGKCMHNNISGSEYINFGYTSFQNGRFIIPGYSYSNSVYTSYLSESTDGIHWKTSIFPVTNIIYGGIVTLWDGVKYIYYVNRIYDTSGHYNLEVYSGEGPSSLTLVNSLKEGYTIPYRSADQSITTEVRLVFDSKYTESYNIRHEEIYQMVAGDLFCILSVTACFENYELTIPKEILLGSTRLNKYYLYFYYKTLYIDNLFLYPSEHNFIWDNWAKGGRKYGVSIAEYYAKGGQCEI